MTMTGILGRKVGMTRIFDDTGAARVVTVIEVGSCRVLRIKTKETDGYRAVQLGYGARKRPRRADKGQVPAGSDVPLFVREFALPDGEEPEVGSPVAVTEFAPGEEVDVTGTSRGKGYAGSIKKYHFGRGPMEHGSKYHRGPGSLSARASGGGGRVHPGRRLPGQMGNVRRTVQSLRVVRVDEGRGLLLVEGSVPGARGGYVMVKRGVKARKTKGGRS